MPRNIALFSDGTGNSSAKLFRTNVWRLYQMLDLSGPDQIAYYDNGVGTSSFKPYAILGGALGLGLKRNVKDIYRFLSRNYQPGDRIHAFGFSRGAFTIRVLVGLVHDQGLAHGATDAELSRDVDAKWWAYRKRSRTKVLGRLLRSKARPRSAQAADSAVTFAFVGLWDTVSAYGLPIDELSRAWDQYVWPLSMNDRIPSDSIEKAFHALSLDDERATFHPVLWTEAHERPNASSTHLTEERISQVWFAGVHSNLGGGYPDDSLSYVSLAWIMREAVGRGLRFQEGQLSQAQAEPSPNGPLYDSRHGLAGYYRYNPRKIAKLIADDYHEVSIARPKIHESVFKRMRSGDDRYAPIVLPETYAVVNADGAISGGAQGNGVETPPQARARAAAQERAWDLVWWRRLVYFATVATSLTLAAFPLHFGRGPCASGSFCVVASAIEVAGSFLPAFAAPWIDTFKANPGWFALCAGILAVFLFVSGRLSQKIKDTMRLIWNPILAPGGGLPPARGRAGFIYWLRSRPAYEAFFHILTRRVLPLVFAVTIYAGMYYVGFAVLSRINLSISTHVLCKETAGAPPAGSTAVVFTFHTNAPCAPSGYTLEKGGRYHLWIRIDEAWADDDGGDGAGLEGFSRTWPNQWRDLALPFRRWLRQPWFKPIARIGSKGDDEYPLEPWVPFPAGDKKQELFVEILARSRGELFLYVNDAVFFGPWLDAYGNNRGTATVSVQRVDAPPVPK